jgi:predicted permease
MLTRCASRRREIAMCLALGAGRMRVTRQVLIEALVLAMLGGTGGFLVAIWGTSMLSSMLAGVLPVVLDITPDWRVLAFAAGLSCLTAVIFGLLPTLSATRLDPVSVVRNGGRDARGGSRVPLGRTLVATQIAVSLVLLVAAGLFVRSLMNLRDVSLGFDADAVVLLRVSLAGDQRALPAETRRHLYRRLLERASGLPGVERASAATSGVLSSDTWRNVITIDGMAPADGQTLRSFVNAVTPAYFDVMGIAVFKGRRFSDADREGTAGVAIVNAAFVRQFLGKGEAIGARVGLCRSESCGVPGTQMLKIVGVVDDTKHSDLQEAARPLVYVPFAQVPQNLREIQVRVAGDVPAVAATLYKALSDVDRRLAIVGMATARERLDASLAAENMVARVSSAFGLLALALAAVGLGGLIHYTTAQRTQEIGVRMALGASLRDVRRLVLGNTLRLVAIGVGVGFPAALGLSRLISGLLFDAAGGVSAGTACDTRRSHRGAQGRVVLAAPHRGLPRMKLGTRPTMPTPE